jgi:hypothetical protein
MDNVQKYDSYINILSSEIYRPYLEKAFCEKGKSLKDKFFYIRWQFLV